MHRLDRARREARRKRRRASHRPTGVVTRRATGASDVRINVVARASARAKSRALEVDEPQPALTVAAVVHVVDARELRARVHVRRVLVAPIIEVRPRRADRHLVVSRGAARRGLLEISKYGVIRACAKESEFVTLEQIGVALPATKVGLDDARLAPRRAEDEISQPVVAGAGDRVRDLEERRRPEQVEAVRGHASPRREQILRRARRHSCRFTARPSQRLMFSSVRSDIERTFSTHAPAS